jgi:hypothetical protein
VKLQLLTALLTQFSIAGVVKNQWYNAWIKTGMLQEATEKKDCELD